MVDLRRELGWDEEFYWRVQGHLIGEGEARRRSGQRRFSPANRNSRGRIGDRDSSYLGCRSEGVRDHQGKGPLCPIEGLD